MRQKAESTKQNAESRMQNAESRMQNAERAHLKARFVSTLVSFCFLGILEEFRSQAAIVLYW